MNSPSHEIVIYGAWLSPDARRARRFFGEHGLAYAWIGIDEDNDATDFVRATNGGHIIIPVIVFHDQSVLVEPTNYQLAKKMEELGGQANSEN